MLNLPAIDPVIFANDVISVEWSNIAFLLNYLLLSIAIRVRCRRENNTLSLNTADQSLFYGFIGALIGSHIGYLLLYQLDSLLHNPALLFNFQQGGMSFHGGLIGVWLVLWIIAKNHQTSVFKLTDFFAPLIPLGIFVIAMTNAATRQPIQYDIQLYSALFQGILLFIVLVCLSLWLSYQQHDNGNKTRPFDAMLTALFLIGYSSCYLIISWLHVDTMNRHNTILPLNSIMILFGLVLLSVLLYRRFVVETSQDQLFNMNSSINTSK